jgi:MFS family permease
VAQISLRQRLCEPELLGRMNATMRFLVWGTMPIGGLLGGLFGTLFGVRPTIWIGAIGGALAFLPVFLSPLRRMRELPTQPEDAPEPVTAA